MWTTEGKGKVPPRVVPVAMDRSDIRICSEDARGRSRYRGYGVRNDKWGRGLIGDDTGILPVFYGNLGEVAFARWATGRVGVLVTPDWRRMIFGDRGRDFVVAGYRIQVKTAATDYRDLLVRTTEVDVKQCDVFVRAHWCPPRLRRVENGLFGVVRRWEPVVDLCGWSWHRDVIRYGVVRPSGRGTHKNYAVPPTLFRKIDDLAELLIARLSKEKTSE